MEKITQPDTGMELCYECKGGRNCIICRGSGKIKERKCSFCVGSGKCIVCNGDGQVSEGVYDKLVAKGIIKKRSR